MKRLLSIVLLLVSLSAAAQTVDKNAAYLEIGGNGLFSLNYERRMTEAWLGRVGFSFGLIESTSDDDDGWVVVVPVMANRLSHPRGNHHFETGAGLVLIAGDSADFEEDEFSGGVIGTATVGYRFQRPQGGFVFRAGFTPFFDFEEFLPFAGISFGYAW